MLIFHHIYMSEPSELLFLCYFSFLVNIYHSILSFLNYLFSVCCCLATLLAVNAHGLNLMLI